LTYEVSFGKQQPGKIGANEPPVCGAKEALRHLLDAAATPPFSGGVLRHEGCVKSDAGEEEKIA
jgi:hypothetical protein